MLRNILPVLTMLACGCAAADADAVRGIDYRPGSDVPRLASVSFDSDDVGLLYDFDLDGDTLFLLDRTGRVLVAGRGAQGWTLTRTFGRRGGGPGEFTAPTGISVRDDAVAVIDGSRLQRFTRDGSVTASGSVALPCAMMLPGVAYAADGMYLHGNCVRGSFVTDTVIAVLTWSRDTVWQVVAEDLRYTRDGSAGNIFGATNALNPGRDGAHLFGTGTSPCMWLVKDGATPAATRRCDLVTQLYRADPPPGLEARLRAAGPGGSALAWPSTLPAFVERIAVGDHLLLLRPYTADSVVVQMAAPDARDIAVAPLDGLIGCKAAGCVWALEDVGAVRLIVLDTLDLAQRVR